MFLRIQTWFPYNVQLYLNGHEYLSRLLQSEGIPYSMYNNSFSYIEDFDRAQEMADRVLRKKLSYGQEHCEPIPIRRAQQNDHKKISGSNAGHPCGKGS